MLVSIITINLNDKTGLEKTCSSVFAQTFKDYEHIIIDGASIDGSLDYIETHKDKFTYWISEPDSGVYNAMNKGIRQAKGDYVLFLNSGDILYNENVFSKVENSLVKDIDLVYGNLWIEGRKGEGFTNKYPGVIDFNFFKRTSLGHAATFIKRTLFETYGVYRTDLKIVSDWAFFFKLICLEKRSYLKIDTIIAVFYEGGLSTASSYNELHKEERKKVLLENYDLYDINFDQLLISNKQHQKFYNKINPRVELVTTNRFFLKILNSIIGLFAFILKKKRS
ncbi:glycosyltransferase family 2 protein [Dokdonia sp. 4H-3-7-5]|uniref:glycosyltransferase family 2 protein n=1 Tax=Dokdonia sp. (strain 4H-3-7-5) TaxID=983548 RepID=UPI00020A64B2|nr:glycosyltransferase family 2 protein [Dokdonia sp. 4H-3-7-5]AEE20033.1 glycosyl transferase family 2 [Dokdonia sp. 4H-3-7-5]